MPGDSSELLYRQIGEAISSIRQRRVPKMSQQSLADAVGISRVSITNIERGHHRVQLHVLYDIAAALDVEPHDLLPHLTDTTQRADLPPDFTKTLTPRERAAVGRLLNAGKEVENNETE